jgi:hypothetical protein
MQYNVNTTMVESVRKYNIPMNVWHKMLENIFYSKFNQKYVHVSSLILHSLISTEKLRYVLVVIELHDLAQVQIQGVPPLIY